MGITLKMLRARYNFTQAEASESVGVSEGTWRNWETGKSFPDVQKIIKLEEVFKVKYDDIIFLPENHGFNVNKSIKGVKRGRKIKRKARDEEVIL